jgi:2-dehydropantoate 2-reductase
VLQDWTKGRRSEADDLNGVVAREGTRVGVPTPVNAAIVELALQVEAGRLAPAPANLDLLLSILR